MAAKSPQPPRQDPDPSEPGWTDHILSNLVSRPMPGAPDPQSPGPPEAAGPAPEPPPAPRPRPDPAPVPPPIPAGNMPATPPAGMAPNPATDTGSSRLLNELVTLGTAPLPSAETPATASTGPGTPEPETSASVPSDPITGAAPATAPPPPAASAPPAPETPVQAPPAEPEFVTTAAAAPPPPSVTASEQQDRPEAPPPDAPLAGPAAAATPAPPEPRVDPAFEQQPQPTAPDPAPPPPTTPAAPPLSEEAGPTSPPGGAAPPGAFAPTPSEQQVRPAPAPAAPSPVAAPSPSPAPVAAPPPPAMVPQPVAPPPSVGPMVDQEIRPAPPLPRPGVAPPGPGPLQGMPMGTAPMPTAAPPRPPGAPPMPPGARPRAPAGDPLLAPPPRPPMPADAGYAEDFVPTRRIRRKRRGRGADPDDPTSTDELEGFFDEDGEPLEELRSPMRTALGWVVTIAIAIVLSILIRQFVAHAFHVESGSMLPTLQPGDRILVNKLSDNPSRGDLIVFERPNGDLVKRVIALEGETVYFEDGFVRIGDQWLTEPYLPNAADTHAPGGGIPNCTSPPDTATIGCTVPEGHVFVLGDSRRVSFDSRNFGPVPRSDIIGTAFLQFWPFGDIGGL